MKKKNRFSLLSSYDTSLWNVLFSLIFIILLYTCTAAFLTALNGKYNLSFSNVNKVIQKIETPFFTNLLTVENVNYSLLLSEDNRSFSISEMIFEVVTTVSLDDPRTFLGNEIPGMWAYNQEMIVSRGSTLSGLSFDIPPTEDEIQNEGEPAEGFEEGMNGEVEEPDEKEPSLTTDGKKVLYVFHTHNRESYFPMLKEGTTSPNHSKANITYVGTRLGKILEEKGIGVQVDTTDIYGMLLTRGIGYEKSYAVAREVLLENKNDNSDLQYFIDFHRDSSGKKVSTATINGKNYAKVLFIVGTNNATHEKNKKQAVKFEKILNEKYEGISRGVKGQGGAGNNGVYNQDVSPNSFLIEVGGVENTKEELNNTVDAIADAFMEFYWSEEGKDN